MNPASPAPDLRDLAPQLAMLLAAIFALLRALGAHGFDRNLGFIPIVLPSATPAHAAGCASQIDHLRNEPGAAEFIAPHLIRNSLHHAIGVPSRKPPPPPESPVGWDALERPNTQPRTPQPPTPRKPGTRPIPPAIQKTA